MSATHRQIVKTFFRGFKTFTVTCYKSSRSKLHDITKKFVNLEMKILFMLLRILHFFSKLNANVFFCREKVFKCQDHAAFKLWQLLSVYSIFRVSNYKIFYKNYFKAYLLIVCSGRKHRILYSIENFMSVSFFSVIF